VSDETTPPPGTPPAGDGTPAAPGEGAAPEGKPPRPRTSPSRPRARSPRPRAPRAGAGAAGEEVTPVPGEGAAAPEGKPPRARARSPRPPAASSRPRTEISGVPEDQIAGYVLEEQIGLGGMAVVYRARDERLDRRVALKLLSPGLAADAAFRQRFIRESRAAAAVDHPNIIPIYEAGDAGGSLFIAMRYVQGGDVRSLLERHGPLSSGRAWSIITQVAAALDAAHASGLVHRDVKPANMLLDASARATAQGPGFLPDDRPEHVYLSDFGISKQSLSTSNLTLTGQFVGTLDYIAPEQIDGHNVDGRADQYSLGCAAYELLSGTPPFRRDQGLAMITAHLSEPPPSLAARRGDLPTAVDRVLAAAMAKSPDERYVSCEQFAADLGRALGLVPGEPEPRGPRQRAGAGPGAGDQRRPRPATEIAGRAPGPDASPARDLAPGGQHDAWPPAGLPPVPAGSRQAAGVPGSPSPTMYGGPQGPAGGTWPVGPPGSYGPGGPGWQQQAPARRSRGLIVGVIVAVVVVAAAAAAGAAVLAGHNRDSPAAVTAPATPVSSTAPVSPSPSASPSPSGSAAASAEASAVSNLLSSGATSSTVLTNAVDEVQACSDMSSSLRQIQRVRNQRQTEYGQAQDLSTGALQNGAELKSDLTKALFYSLSADNDYLAWAQQQDSDCQSGSQSTSALTVDDQAVNYKTLFVNLWNPLAAQYGLPSTSVSSM
jgi:hypothetical protein